MFRSLVWARGAQGPPGVRTCLQRAGLTERVGSGKAWTFGVDYHAWHLALWPRYIKSSPPSLDVDLRASNGLQY